MFIKAGKSTFISKESDIKITFDEKGGKYLLNIFFSHFKADFMRQGNLQSRGVAFLWPTMDS